MENTTTISKLFQVGETVEFTDAVGNRRVMEITSFDKNWYCICRQLEPKRQPVAKWGFNRPGFWKSRTLLSRSGGKIMDDPTYKEVFI